ncbi:peptidoglycan-binding domain-containing protein [Nocardia donostiensis]|nr:peptidoglycan-binding domain-containing protein [Nocardia donostiensis]
MNRIGTTRAAGRVLRAMVIAVVGFGAVTGVAQASPGNGGLVLTAPRGAEPADIDAESADSESVIVGCLIEEPTLRRGDDGVCVAVVQLIVSDYYGNGTVEVDGVFGSRTQQAVRNFQRYYDIRVDGIVGPQTWDALGSACTDQGLCRSSGAAGRGN